MGQLLSLPMLAAGLILLAPLGAPRVTPLAALTSARRIAAEGPLRLDAYMALCLGLRHGYYATRDPLGAAGDFITAPEISQMFGELVGAWAAQVWADQGRPDPFVLAELGPGRGTLMRDALRAAAALPGFRAAARLWLVETSPALRGAPGRDARRRGAALGRPRRGAAARARSSSSPTSSSTPCRSASSSAPTPSGASGMVGLDGDRLAFAGAPPRAGRRPRRPLPAACPTAPSPRSARRPRRSPPTSAPASPAQGGAALLVDYGAWDGSGDTLQAVRRPRPRRPARRARARPT